MPNYDFTQLSPHDFELLSRDLIQKLEGFFLESFTIGRDSGIDFRCLQPEGKVVVQCKHYSNTPYTGLKANLKKEAIKVATLKPARYILTTSAKLTPDRKKEIQEIFGEILSVNDIHGADDLNNFISQYPEVEQQHYKLWLTSTEVLNRIIHNASVIQSEFEISRIRRDICRYVQNDTFSLARTMLNERHVVIISGSPGVGKTTLARMLICISLEDGYELVPIMADFHEGRKRYQPGKKQIFYFDDFLGATFLGEQSSSLSRNEDRAILDFIEMVQHSPLSRLVLTTRGHILQQAISLSEKLKHSCIIDTRCVLEINDYTERQRAQILYNHIYFSELPTNYRNELLANHFYKEIIRHPKFNPRVIDWLSDFHRVKKKPVNEYKAFVRNLISNPSEIWSYAYEHQISNAAQSVLLALYSFKGKCGLMLLEQSFLKLHKFRAQRYGFDTRPSDWRLAFNELDGTFIRPGNLVEVLDPSVLDMLNTTIVQDPANALDILEGALRFQQGRHIWSFVATTKNQKILNHFLAEPDRITNALEHLLQRPQKVPVGNGVAFIDDSLAARISTLIHIAEKLLLNGLSNLTHSALHLFLTNPEAEWFDINDSLSLISNVKKADFVFGSERDNLCIKIIHKLINEDLSGCTAAELYEILMAVKSENMLFEYTGQIRNIIEEYIEFSFNDDINQCQSIADFDELLENLSSISESINLNMTDTINFIKDARNTFEESQSEYENQAYEEKKERHYYSENKDIDLDALFYSLHSQD
ncbi:TPA: restriction endonuclease [Klebsiella oxytoca]|nr:restriction endonuclease [Klebsiella oxytoca]